MQPDKTTGNNWYLPICSRAQTYLYILVVEVAIEVGLGMRTDYRPTSIF